jgi:serpin B
MNKKPIKPIITIIVILFIILSAFVVFTTYLENLEVIDEHQEADKNFSSLGNLSSFNDAVNTFSFDIFEKFLNDPKNKDNLFMSPYSIFTALAMTYEGAKGKTAEEMKEVLNIEQDNESFHEYMQSLYNYLNYNQEYNISTANALWIKENYPILDKYKDLILTYYGGNSIDIDYSIPDQAAGIINGWVENKTNNLIQNLISPGDIDPFLTVLILTNAIYFKGIWQVQFDEKNTTERSFEVSEGEYIQVETMSLTEKQKKFNYTENEIMQILELPYSGNEISMNIFLPREGYNLSDIIKSMNHEDYKELIESMVETELDIYLPKFIIKTPLYTLNDYLINLGMSTAFKQNADFSGITEIENININKVLHKAYVEVNEIGTEAAAATAVTMFKTGIDDQENLRIVFDADHPFLFTIHHKEIGTILFMGNIIDPSSE